MYSGVFRILVWGIVSLLPSLPSSPFPPLEVGPLNIGSLGKAVSSHSGIWGEAPAAERFG